MSQQLPASALQDPAFLELPALPPPPGVLPNFTDPESNGQSSIIAGAILVTVIIITVANRAYTKLCIIRKTSWDDLTLSLSAVGAIASYGILVYGNVVNTFFSINTNKLFLLAIQDGVLGKHQYDLHLKDLLRNSFTVVSVTPCLALIRTILIIFTAELHNPCN